MESQRNPVGNILGTQWRPNVYTIGDTIEPQWNHVRTPMAEPAASKDLNEFLKINPTAMYYNPHLKRYEAIPTEGK